MIATALNTQRNSRRAQGAGASEVRHARIAPDDSGQGCQVGVEGLSSRRGRYG